MRLGEFCKKNKVTPTRGLSMLELLYPTNVDVSLHYKLSADDIQNLTLILKGKFVGRATHKRGDFPPERYVSVQVVDRPSKMSKEVMEFLVGKGIRMERPKRLVINGDQSLPTVFQDFEAYALCCGMKNPSARKLYDRFSRGANDNSDDYRAHEFAMLFYEQYGSSILEFLINLPPLPFQCGQVNDVFKLMDLRRRFHQSPALRFVQGDSRFIIEFARIEERLNTFVLRVRNESSNSEFYFQRDSRVKAVGESLKLSDLRIFLHFDKNSNKMLLAYGAETGYCAVCGRQLFTLESLRRGMGPVCAASIGMRNWVYV